MNIIEGAPRYSRPQSSRQFSRLPAVSRAVDCGLASEPAGLPRPRHASSGANQARRAITRNRLPSSCNNWSLRLRSIRILSWHKSWAASTFPEQVVEADRWVQAHPDLKRRRFRPGGGPATLGTRALRRLPRFHPSSEIWTRTSQWASSLGDAYYNQEQDVMDAVQVMRQKKAEESGNLKTTPQQNRNHPRLHSHYSAR